MWSIHTQTKLTSFQQINDFTLSIWNMNFSHHGAFLINWTLLCNGTWKQSAWQTRGHWPSKWAIIIEIWRLTAPSPERHVMCVKDALLSQWDTRDLSSLGHWNYSITWFLTAARLKHAGHWMVIGFPYFPRTFTGSVKKRLTGNGGKLDTSQAMSVAASSWAVGQFLSISLEAFILLTR